MFPVEQKSHLIDRETACTEEAKRRPLRLSPSSGMREHRSSWPPVPRIKIFKYALFPPPVKSLTQHTHTALILTLTPTRHIRNIHPGVLHTPGDHIRPSTFCPQRCLGCLLLAAVNAWRFMQEQSATDRPLTKTSILSRVLALAHGIKATTKGRR